MREDHLDQTDSIISLVKIEEEQDFSVSVTGFPLCDFVFQFYCICISTLLVFVFHLFCICISTKAKEGRTGVREDHLDQTDSIISLVEIEEEQEILYL